MFKLYRIAAARHLSEMSTMSPSLPYTVVQTRDRGKCVIAARDIEAGELVLEDTPLLVTPLIKSKPQCLQCARFVIIYF